jgi:hypothetical protein
MYEENKGKNLTAHQFLTWATAILTGTVSVKRRARDISRLLLLQVSHLKVCFATLLTAQRTTHGVQ